MKHKPSLFTLSKSLILACVCLLGSSFASAQVVLTFNYNDVDGAWFEGTSGLASATASVSNGSIGVTLLDFFTAVPGGSSVNLQDLGSTLIVAQSPSGAIATLNHASVNLPVLPQTALNLWDYNSWTFNFVLGQVAFTGQAYPGGLGAYSDQFPAPGTTGNIYAGYWDPVNPPPVIGQWLAVPEPHEYALMASVGLLGLAAWRRRGR